MAHVYGDLVTGSPVIDEFMAGPAHRVKAWLDLIRHLPVLKIEPPVLRIAEQYVRHKLMPGEKSYDAYHLALASYYECDLLVTWDLKHLANPNKFDHIRRVNSMLRLFVPAIVTPRNLLGGEDE